MELIDRDALMEEAHWIIRSDGTRVYAVHAEDVENAPTVDAVPVVRCKDCKHFGISHDCNFHAADENGTPIFVREDDFCSYGEQKEGGHK